MEAIRQTQGFTIRQAFQDFIDSRISSNTRPGTIRGYRFVTSRFEAYLQAQGVSTTADIQPPHIRGWLAGMLQDGLKGSTVRTYRRNLLTCVTWLSEEGYCDTHQWGKRIPSMKVDTKDPRFLTEDECRRLLKAAEGMPLNKSHTPFIHVRNIAMIRLFLDTGLRLREMLNLRLCDVDLANRTITVSSQSKGRRSRTVFYGKAALLALIEWLEIREKRTGPDPEGWLWLSQEMTQLAGASVWRMLGDLGQVAGLEDLHPHCLRHTFATIVLGRGMGLVEVQRLLGHTEPNQTLKYIHLLTSDIQRKYRDYCPGDGL